MVEFKDDNGNVYTYNQLADHVKYLATENDSGTKLIWDFFSKTVIITSGNVILEFVEI